MENYKSEATVEINVYDYQNLVNDLAVCKTTLEIIERILASDDYTSNETIKKILGMEDKAK
mgnify:FL=1